MAAGMLLWAAAAAAGQVSPGWFAREHLGASGTDECVEQVYLEVGTDRWLFATGYVVDPDGGTRYATYKYRADVAGTGEQDPPLAIAYYPPLGVPAGTYRATGIAVDSREGHEAVYVTGYAQNKINDPEHLDYVTIKYRYDNLVYHDDWSQASEPEPGRRRYNDPVVNQDDRAVDIAVSRIDGLVFVTGTSRAFNSSMVISDDIVTVSYSELGGNNAAWGTPNPSVRKFDGVGGSDLAAALALMHVTEDVDEAGTWAYVTGSSYQGGCAGCPKNDIVTIAYSPSGQRGPAPYGWTALHNRGDAAGTGNDYGTAMNALEVQSGSTYYNVAVLVAGYSEAPEANAASGLGPSGSGALLATPDTDYTTKAYHPFLGTALWGPPGGDGARYWNGPGGAGGNDDYARAISSGYSATQGWLVWVIGDTKRDTGYDCGNLLYRLTDGVRLCVNWFGGAGALDDRGHDILSTVNTLDWAWGAGRTTLTAGNTDAFLYKWRYIGGGDEASNCAYVWYTQSLLSGFDAARRVILTPYDGLFTAGQATFPTTNIDFMSRRFTEP